MLKYNKFARVCWQDCQCVQCGWGFFLTRPEKSLHFTSHNPITNLQFIFNPKYSSQFLNPSLWSVAERSKEGFKTAKKLPP